MECEVIKLCPEIDIFYGNSDCRFQPMQLITDSFNIKLG